MTLLKAFSILLLTLACQVAEAAALSARTSSMVNYAIAIDADGGATAKAYVVHPMAIGTSLTAEIGAQVIARPETTLGNIPPLTARPVFTSDKAAVQSIADRVNASVAQLVQRTSTFLQRERITGALVTYNHGVRIVRGGSTITDVVGVSIWIKPDGTYSNMGARLSGTNNYLLYVVYVQRSLATGLPVSWEQANGGHIRWQLLMLQVSGTRAALVPVTAEQSIDVLGAFDQPQGAEGEEVDLNAGLNSMVQSWVLPKMEELNAAVAMIDYSRTVEPVYDDLPDESQVARTAVSIDERRLTEGSCFGASNSQLSVSGRYGYELRYDTDRYMVTADVPMSYVGTETYSDISPTESFTKSSAFPSGTDPGSYASAIIDPFQTSQIYDWHNDTVNGLAPERYVYVSPLVTDSSGASGYLETPLRFSNGAVAGTGMLRCTGDRVEARVVTSPVAYVSLYSGFTAAASVCGSDSGWVDVTSWRAGQSLTSYNYTPPGAYTSYWAPTPRGRATKVNDSTFSFVGLGGAVTLYYGSYAPSGTCVTGVGSLGSN